MEAFRYCFKSETKTFYTLIEYIEIFLHKKALFVGFFKFRIRWLNRSPDHQQRSHIHEELTAERSPPKKMSALYDLLGYFFLFKRLKFYSIRKSKSWNNSVSEGETIKFNRQSSGVVEETWDILCNSFPPGQAVLGNLATSVPSERVFSSAGDLITAQRATLKPEYIDMTVCLQKKIFK